MLYNCSLAIDLIGCGRSDKPKITYTNYLYVQLISDFIKNVVKHKVKVISTGLSSSAVVMTCYIEPKLFENIILINPTEIVSLSKYPKRINKLLKWFIELPILGTFLYNLNYSNIIIKKRFRNLYFYDEFLITNRNIQAYSEAAHLSGSASKYLMSSLYSNYTNININHAIKQINNTVQIILGEELPQCDRIAASYQELNPSIEVEKISQSKYLPQIEVPKKFIEACDIYL